MKSAWLCMAILALMSCSVKKYLRPDAYLYTGATISVDAADTLQTRVLTRSLDEAVGVRRGIRLFGPGIRTYFHYRYHSDEPKGITNKFMAWATRSLSREAVYFNDDIPDRTMKVLRNRASNNGYFQNDAKFTLDTTMHGRGMQVNYTVHVGPDYQLGSLEYAITDTALAAIIQSLSSATLIEPGRRYDLTILKRERLRLQNGIRAKGYYYFTDNDLEFLADTANNDRGVELLLRLKDNTPGTHLTPQRVDSIVIFSNFRSRTDSLAHKSDTISLEGLTIICSHCPLKPAVMREAFAIRKGDLFSPEAHEKTLGRLSSYNTFRHISLSYEQMAGTDSLLLMTAQLTPLLRKRIEGEIGAAYNSGEYFGPELGLTYLNRNLLEGAELLKIDGDFTYAFFLGSGHETRVPQAGTYRLKASLNVPRLWLPARDKLLRSLRQSSTVIQLGGNLESLQLGLRQFTNEIAEGNYDELATLLEQDSSAAPNVTLLQLAGQYGYVWKKKVTRSHSVFPVSIRYQNPVAQSDQLLELSRSIGLAQGDQNLGRLDRMLLISPNYTFLYDTRLKRLRTHNFYFSSNISLNFNHIYPTGDKASTLDRQTSQYIQVEPDFRYYLIFNSRQQIATRLHTGLAFPMGTKVIVPYFDLYTVGGPNSVRGFIPRGIGPGRVVPEDNNLLTEGGYGNVLVEASLEFRQKLSASFEIAAFADAGNIWTFKTADDPLDTDFSISTMLEELGISAGAGIRYHIQSFILRADLAKPIQLPYPTPEGQKIDNKLKLVIGFGYPF